MIFHLQYCPAEQLEKLKEQFWYIWGSRYSSNMLYVVSFIILNVYLSEHYLGHCLIASPGEHNLSPQQTIGVPAPQCKTQRVQVVKHQLYKDKRQN